AFGQRGGDVGDRVDHQVDELVEVAPGEGRVEHPAVAGPRIALVGEQVDARGGPDRPVFVGLDVFQPCLVQYVVDVVGMTDRDETPPAATESGDVAAACPTQESVARVESDGEGLARHGPGVQAFGRSPQGPLDGESGHYPTVWVTTVARNETMGHGVG